MDNLVASRPPELLVFGKQPASFATIQGSLESTMSETAGRLAIEAIIDEEIHAWNNGDAAAFAAHALPDLVFTNVVRMFSVGKHEFEARHAKVFSTFYRGSKMRQTLVHLTFVRPDVAIADTIAEITGFHGLPPGSQAVDGVLYTRLEQVFVLNDGAWWVASFHNVPVDPSAVSVTK